MTDKSCDSCVFYFAPPTSTVCATCGRGGVTNYPNWRGDEPTPPAPTEAKFTPYEAPITDPVTKPSHYQLLPGVEVIDVRKALLDKMQPAGWTHYQSDCWSRSWEYLTRAMAKNGLEDLKKARTYLNWLIEIL